MFSGECLLGDFFNALLPEVGAKKDKKLAKKQGGINKQTNKQ